MPRPKKQKVPPGKPRRYTDQIFIEALTDKPQTTQQVRSVLQKKECCSNISYDTVLTNLKQLAKDGKIGRQELPAGSGSGIMYLWSKKEVEK